jgi:hypothetical protein
MSCNDYLLLKHKLRIHWNFLDMDTRSSLLCIMVSNTRCSLGVLVGRSGFDGHLQCNMQHLSSYQESHQL